MRRAVLHVAQGDVLGRGHLPAVEAFQREIARSAYAYQREIERKERVIVGVNDYVMEDEKIDIPGRSDIPMDHHGQATDQTAGRLAFLEQ